MAFELITGHAGRNHVDSADMGEAFAGIVGKGRYILDTGEGMACTMSDSNTLTVGTGSMLMDGRIVRNETAATFKIANGTQGQYRHDLACLRYTLDRSNDSIESVEQVVLQGTPATTADGAKDPDYEAGDILAGDLTATVPIARVKLDNLTPTCEALLGSVASLAALGDSISPRLLATTSGTATAAIDVSGASLLVVLAKNNYVGITTAIVPVAALSDHVETVHMAGGYRASGLNSNYDCRVSLTTFAGRDAYTNGTNRASETIWTVYGLL